VAKYFAFENHAEYVRHQCRHIPAGDCADGFAFLQKHGVWSDPERPLSRGGFARELTPEQQQGARTDERTGVIYRTAADGAEQPIGVVIDGTPRQGFRTPSRKFEIVSSTVAQQSTKIGLKDDGWPRYIPIPAHVNLPQDRLVLTTFKWNVHTQARTAPQKYLSEIVHDNPLWINTQTALRLGIRSGDLVEVTTYRPKGNTYRATGEKLGSALIRAFVTEGIHPRVLAVSNSLGQLFGGRAATAECRPRAAGPSYDEQLLAEDADLTDSLWWNTRDGGRGGGYNLNAILPIQPAPLTGMQCWFDTVCSIRKL
jgi:thiosulfate reductase/polysulfide reductase chain A